MKRLAVVFFVAVLLLGMDGFAFADIIPIDLNQFYGNPTAVVSLDGASATLSEDSDLSSVLLSNDPYLGDPGIIVPSGLTTLGFTYEFTLAPGNEDNFYAKVFDGISGDVIQDFRAETSGSGQVTWDLTGLSPDITLLGLEFQLNSYDNAFDSFVNISNPRLEATASVPEPSLLALLSLGLVGLARLKRHR